jgi:hypothetical protein
LYEPESHDTQPLNSEIAPIVIPKLPGGQRAQDGDPEILLNEPRAQGIQMLLSQI